MRRVDLPIFRLSLAQKLDLMETLWADRSRDEKKLESPAWHKAVLKDREAAFNAGKVTASDWEQTKKSLVPTRLIYRRVMLQLLLRATVDRMYERQPRRERICPPF